MRKKKLALSDGLSAFIRRKYEIAKKHKDNEVFQTLKDCVSMVRGNPIVELDSRINVDITANIASPIARGVIGMLRDIYGQNSEAPFVLEPTPVVDLPETVKRELVEQIEARKDEMLQAAGYDPDVLSNNLKELRQTTLKFERQRAARAADALTTATKDALIDAGWRTAFEKEAIQNFVMFPTLIVKCPVYKTKMVKKWNGDSYDAEQKVSLCIETVNPFNFYPSPDAVDAQSAEYIIEKRRITYNELLSLSSHSGFDDEGIDLVLSRYEDGHIEPYENGAETITSVDIDGSNNDKNPDKAFDTLGYFGRVPGKVLAEFGVVGITEGASYEAEVWIVGGVVIKARLNPDKLMRRPFYSTSFEPVPNAFWGECPMTRIIEHQRACTSAIAHLFRNVAYSSGPLIEREISRIDGDVEEGVIEPYGVYDVKPSIAGNNKNVHNFIETASHMNDFIGLYNKFKEEAYDAIGIPRALFGGIENMGSVGRTSGGIATVYAQASKAIKYSMRLLEESIIEPVIQRVVDDIVSNTSDESLKGDVRVRARGVSGIVEKENQREQLNWAMQTLIPMMQLTDENGKPLIPPEAPIRLLYEQFKSLGIPTDGIFGKDYETQSAIQSDVGKSPEVVAQPTLDARSPDAVNAIAEMGGAQFNSGVANLQQ